MQSKFHFTVTDLARLLGKSPVTLRGWERQHLVTIPREGNHGDRKLNCDQVIAVAYRAHELKRIKPDRLDIVITAMTILKMVEKENKK